MFNNIWFLNFFLSLISTEKAPPLPEANVCIWRLWILAIVKKSRENKVCFYFIYLFYWNIIDLQYYIGIWCTEKWYNYTYVYIYFSILSSIKTYFGILNTVPCTIQYDLAVYLFYT